ncbi:MAG: ribulose-phosphate 3-epimerase [Candidatus Eremiobacteraeota bacterium]|nr:ribulose-phosphate 3-epimerase [Candidatus Eremiobacteraeota bacterium]
MKVRFSASILGADFSRLAGEVHSCLEAGIDSLHFDIMDGHFVPNLTFGPLVLRALRPLTDIPFSAHLMVENPDFYVQECVEAGASTVIVHAEATPHLHRSLQLIRHKGARAGVAINPSTPLAFLPYVADVTDELLIMTVNPGFAAQSLIKSVIPKIGEASRLARALGKTISISVDGGVNGETIGDITREGADSLVMASAFFGVQNRRALIEELRGLVAPVSNPGRP